MTARLKKTRLRTLMSLPVRVHQQKTNTVRLSQLGKMRECEQVAAVCYRIRRGVIELLLVQTRGTGRWIFPKGSAEPGLTHAQAAAIEAFEEAGVHGRIEEAAFVRYMQRKCNSNRAGSSAKPQLVSAHLCEVRRLCSPKEPNRNRTWFSVKETIHRLEEGRQSEDGKEFARVVQRAVARIEYLRNAKNVVPDLLSRPMLQDELHKVQFEALTEARPRLAQSHRITQPGGRMRVEEIVPCEVLPFAVARHSNRGHKLLSGAIKFKVLGTGAKNG
ncbi:MAG: NUDIX domain-containing protein [Candidatus Sulfotelmatobacter sp.]